MAQLTSARMFIGIKQSNKKTIEHSIDFLIKRQFSVRVPLDGATAPAMCVTPLNQPTEKIDMQRSHTPHTAVFD